MRKLYPINPECVKKEIKPKNKRRRKNFTL
jgi:hypothetical protein